MAGAGGSAAQGRCLEQAGLGPQPLPLSCPENLPNKTQRDQYELLCPDNTRRPVDAFKQCHLARVPSHAVVARSVNGKENEIWRLLSRAQVPAPTACPPACPLGLLLGLPPPPAPCRTGHRAVTPPPPSTAGSKSGGPLA